MSRVGSDNLEIGMYIIGLYAGVLKCLGPAMTKLVNRRQELTRTGSLSSKAVKERVGVTV